MSAMAPARRRPRTLLYPGKGAFHGGGEIFRAADGVGVIVVGEGVAVKQTPHGPVRVTGKVVVEFTGIPAYDAWKRAAFHKNPALYAKTVGVLGLDDDARNAPPLPAGLLGHGPMMPPALRLVATNDGGAAEIAIEPEAPMVAVAGLAERPLAVAAEVDGVPTLAELLMGGGSGVGRR